MRFSAVFATTLLASSVLAIPVAQPASAQFDALVKRVDALNALVARNTLVARCDSQYPQLPCKVSSDLSALEAAIAADIKAINQIISNLDVQTLINDVNSLVSYLKGLIGDLESAIAGLADSAVLQVEQDLYNLINTIINEVKGEIDTINGLISSITSTLKGDISSTLSSAISELNTVIGQLYDYFENCS